MPGVAMLLLVSSGVVIAFGGNLQNSAIAQSVPASQETAVLENSEVSPKITESAITKVYPHQMNGRSAATVYVRNIPIATFLGNETLSATAFAESVEQLNAQGIPGEKIGVKWDNASKQYSIHTGDQKIIAITDGIVLPKTTKDKAEDALQITNLLRRQLSQAEPLKEIEGRPRPVVQKPQPQQVAVNSTQYQQGWASWYGPGFDGNLTASGVRFNQYALTAAHRYLPFGSKVRVTNLDSGRSVVVTINDRGPFIHDRVIDLSKGAAQAIGVVSSGVAPVRLDLIQ